MNVVRVRPVQVACAYDDPLLSVIVGFLKSAGTALTVIVPLDEVAVVAAVVVTAAANGP